ncbi:hypothetical protein GRS48_07895 [Halorubrum sp. JWXQ-INN 858]|uniref:hypothetical protein n=1 Tax=Halorubrum sp. JWXQ-INN 858 TaxID=2690782 RepID=UPI00135A55BB|nr:hypothetical protein [Halorubrum sp. JWXQ-INN 858]MWV64743.1 hypothetical protein [Halorubrum sp. JWXQ-INN 858]
MASVAVGADMLGTIADPWTVSLLQAGITGDPVGQLLIALVAVALVIVVGKFVLSLAWRIVTIGVVVVAVFYLLSTLGLF